MNLFISILILFLISVIVLWLFWKFDKEDSSSEPDPEPFIQHHEPTLVEEIERSNQEFLKSLRTQTQTSMKETDEPVSIPEFNDLTMFTKHQSPAPKQSQEISFTGFDHKKLSMMNDAEMIEGDNDHGLMTKHHWSLEKNKIEPRMTLALKMNPGLVDAWKSANKGPTTSQAKTVLDAIQAKTGLDVNAKDQ